MNDKYYVLLDNRGDIPGYPTSVRKPMPGHPVFFNYEFDRKKHNCIDDSFDSCSLDQLEVRVKHRKIDFDFHPARGNRFIKEFYISENLLQFFQSCKCPPFRSKPISFYGKNNCKVTVKEYSVVSFYETPEYINRNECLYVIPDGYEVFERNLVRIGINKLALDGFDILPSILPTFPHSLIVSEEVKNKLALLNFNFTYLLLEEAPLVLFNKLDGENYDVDKLPKYTEKELNEMDDLE